MAKQQTTDVPAVMQVPAVRSAVVEAVVSRRKADAAGRKAADVLTDLGFRWTDAIAPGYKARGVESTATKEGYAAFQALVMDGMTRRVGGKVEFTKADREACLCVIADGRKDSDASDVATWDAWKTHVSGYVGMIRDQLEAIQDPEGFTERRTATKHAKGSTKGARKGARAAGKGAKGGTGAAFNIGKDADPCEVLAAWLELFSERSDEATANVDAALEALGYKRGE